MGGGASQPTIQWLWMDDSSRCKTISLSCLRCPFFKVYATCRNVSPFDPVSSLYGRSELLYWIKPENSNKTARTISNSSSRLTSTHHPLPRIRMCFKTEACGGPIPFCPAQAGGATSLPPSPAHYTAQIILRYFVMIMMRDSRDSSKFAAVSILRLLFRLLLIAGRPGGSSG